MTEDRMGKIRSIRLGSGGYQDAEFGVTVDLSGNGWGVGNFKGAWDPSIKITEHSKWTEDDRQKQFAEVMTWLAKLMQQAKVRDFNDLVGKPVMVTFDRMMLKSWRLLTEVL